MPQKGRKMRTAKNLEVDRSVVYECELLKCATCNCPLSKCNYRSGRKVVQSLDDVLAISYQPYRCMNPECANYGNRQYRKSHPVPLALTSQPPLPTLPLKCSGLTLGRGGEEDHYSTRINLIFTYSPPFPLLEEGLGG